MRELILIATLILFSTCEKTVKRKPFKVGICVKERSRFVASFSPEAYETYKFKSIVNNGYYTYRYDLKGKPMFYRWISFEDVRKRDFDKVQCPDQKKMKLFVEE
jgi:hypothetical protein